MSSSHCLFWWTFIECLLDIRHFAKYKKHKNEYDLVPALELLTVSKTDKQIFSIKRAPQRDQHLQLNIGAVNAYDRWGEMMGRQGSLGFSRRTGMQVHGY